MNGITGFDHVAIPVSDVMASFAFYRSVLDATAPFEADFLAGRTPVLRIEMGGCVINLHRSPSDSWLIAQSPTVGGADLCFRWSGPIEAAVARLKARGIAIVEGPAPRRASDGRMGQSVYFRDLDGNLLELLTVD